MKYKLGLLIYSDIKPKVIKEYKKENIWETELNGLKNYHLVYVWGSHDFNSLEQCIDFIDKKQRK